jgi:hypothetical protein
MEAKHASSTTAKRPSTCSLKREMVGLYTHFAKKKKKKKKKNLQIDVAQYDWI